MSDNQAIGLNENQYLHVMIQVPTEKSQAFMEAMEALIPVFTGTCPPPPKEPTAFGWHLITSAKEGDSRNTTFFNLWQTPDPARPTLWEVMQQLGTLPDYATLDQLVVKEVQDLFHSVDYYTPLTWPATSCTHLVHECLEMTADVVALNTFENQMPLFALEMKEQFGWTLSIALLSMTGALRRFVHLWQVQDPSNVEAAKTWMAGQGIYQHAVLKQTLTVFDNVSYTG